jgi:hypothetical protein
MANNYLSIDEQITKLISNGITTKNKPNSVSLNGKDAFIGCA